MPLSTTVTPAERLQGTVRVPGDKSISHRYALIAALSDGPSRLTNYSAGADCQSTLACIRGLGLAVHGGADGRVDIAGEGPFGFHAPERPLDAGNSGTTMRMLSGILAGQRFTATMIGDESLSRRPMRRIIEPLLEMGALVVAVDGHSPLTITGRQLHGIHYRTSVPSAQVKSAVLLAGLLADGPTSVTESAQTRDHTERALRAFGFEVTVDGLTVTVHGGQRGHGRILDVPGDFSSAAFWMAGAASMPGSRVRIEGVGLNPTRIQFLDVLRRFGARVTVEPTSDGTGGEPLGVIVVEGDRREIVDIAPDEVPALIDELPAIAALAAFEGSVRVSGASELRVKESDRIATLTAGFRGLGIDAEERPDGFVVRGHGAPAGGAADAAGDHRMAMAFAIAALSARRPSTIDGADSVVISYPGFFDTLERLLG